MSDLDLSRWMQRRLQCWFRRHARDLPWRRTRDPYAIWVSEIMLQQTQVATVVPYYHRFLKAFPTVRRLARAPEHDVLRLWEGLGYYRRARNLHRAAQAIMKQHAGRFPRDPATLHSLPGCGRYTTGAVLSQAFDLRYPIVEANSQRVLCRVLGYRDDPRSGPGRRFLWQAAESLLPRTQVGEFNQALMELGALLCTPRGPDCSGCPLTERCAARRANLQDSIPLQEKPVAIEAVAEVAVVVRRNGRVLLVRRPDHGRWAGLWEFPHRPQDTGENVKQTATRLTKELTGLTVSLQDPIMTIRHGVTRFRITMTCLAANYRRGSFRSKFYTEGRWVRVNELTAFPVSSPQRKLAQTLRQG